MSVKAYFSFFFMNFETVFKTNKTAINDNALMINLLFVVTTKIDNKAQAKEKLANNKTNLS